MLDGEDGRRVAVDQIPLDSSFGKLDPAGEYEDDAAMSVSGAESAVFSQDEWTKSSVYSSQMGAGDDDYEDEDREEEDNDGRSVDSYGTTTATKIGGTSRRRDMDELATFAPFADRLWRARTSHNVCDADTVHMCLADTVLALVECSHSKMVEDRANYEDLPGTSTDSVTRDDPASIQRLSTLATLLAEQTDETASSGESCAARSLARYFSSRPKGSSKLAGYALKLLSQQKSSIGISPSSGRNSVMESDSAQLSFKLHANVRASVLLTEQSWRCAGCHSEWPKGVPITPNRAHFCHYYGRLFCVCCHRDAREIVPARVLHDWNFKPMPVSERAAHLLGVLRSRPIIDLSIHAPKLVKKVRVLRAVVQLRTKLNYIWQYVRVCRHTEGAVDGGTSLRSRLSRLEPHLLGDPYVFSLDNLAAVLKGELAAALAPLVQLGRTHIETCKLCSGQAFVCELCGSSTDLLFPYQTERTAKCADCGTLFHARCAARSTVQLRNGGCPKCMRIAKLMIRRRFGAGGLPSTSSDDDNGREH